MIVGSIDERLQPGLIVINGTELLDRSDLLIAIVDSLLQIFREESNNTLKSTHTDCWIQT